MSSVIALQFTGCAEELSQSADPSAKNFSNKKNKIFSVNSTEADLNEDGIVRLNQLTDVDGSVIDGSDDATGAFVWEAGLLCAQYMVSQMQEGGLLGNLFLDDKIPSVVELGAGCGTVGIAIAVEARIRQKLLRVHLTDFSAQMRLNLSKNAYELNGLNKELVTIDNVDFCEPSTWNVLEKADVLVGSDIIYDQKIASQILKMIDFYITANENGKVILLSSTERDGLNSFDTDSDSYPKMVLQRFQLPTSPYQEVSPLVDCDDLVLKMFYPDFQKGRFDIIIISAKKKSQEHLRSS